MFTLHSTWVAAMVVPIKCCLVSRNMTDVSLFLEDWDIIKTRRSTYSTRTQFLSTSERETVRTQRWVGLRQWTSVCFALLEEWLGDVQSWWQINLEIQSSDWVSVLLKDWKESFTLPNNFHFTAISNTLELVRIFTKKCIPQPICSSFKNATEASMASETEYKIMELAILSTRVSSYELNRRKGPGDQNSVLEPHFLRDWSGSQLTTDPLSFPAAESTVESSREIRTASLTKSNEFVRTWFWSFTI